MNRELLGFQAVLFDFDGTLADSFQAITASVNHVRARHGLPPLAVEGVKGFVGRGAGYLLENTVPGGELEADVAYYKAHHPSVMLEGTQLLPGAFETLRTLHEAGKKLGLCSNKPRQFSREILDHLKVLPWFDLVLGPEDVARLKPAPDMLLAALERLQLRADQVLYVGDMTVDIQAARGAGVPVWIVPTGVEERSVVENAGPDLMLKDIRDLIRK